jgi:CTP synthase
MWTRDPDLSLWENLVKKIKNLKDEVKIALVGKYVRLKDSYKSLNEALVLGGVENDVKVEIKYVDSEELENSRPSQLLSDVDGILIPGGFGSRGIEGKIEAIKYARKKEIPFLGICLGMQLAVVEFCRNVLGLKSAHSQEFSPNTPHPVIYLMREWYNPKTGQWEKRDENSDLGGTMRLGAYPCKIKEGTLAHKIYGTTLVMERHRHRYEFNNKYRDLIEKGGLRVSGESPDHQLVEIVELPDHPWFFACQFHPEFKTRVFQPHPVFVKFIEAAKKRRG